MDPDREPVPPPASGWPTVDVNGGSPWAPSPASVPTPSAASSPGGPGSPGRPGSIGAPGSSWGPPYLPTSPPLVPDPAGAPPSPWSRPGGAPPMSGGAAPWVAAVGPPTGSEPGSWSPAPGPDAPKRRTGMIVAAVATAGLLAGAVGGVIGAKVSDNGSSSASVNRSPVTTRAKAVSSGGSTGAASASTQPPASVAPIGSPSPAIDVRAVIAAVEPSVVQVTSQLAQGTAIGTGFIINADGEILTNAHVVNGATVVRVRLAGESQAREVQVVGADATNDVALLKVTGVDKLSPVQLGAINQVQVGDPVVAIGYALGLRGEPTVTTGIVSGTDRTLDTLTGLVQTDTAINPGNSGGPLVDAAGRVIGINTAKLSGNGASGSGSSASEPGFENVGFAITIDDATKIADRLRTGAPVASAGYLGVGTVDSSDGGLGAQIRTVEAGTPAAAAGLQPGDVIVGVDGSDVSGQADLGRAIRTAGPGGTIKLTIDRNGAKQDVTVTLATRPSNLGN